MSPCKTVSYEWVGRLSHLGGPGSDTCLQLLIPVSWQHRPWEAVVIQTHSLGPDHARGRPGQRSWLLASALAQAQPLRHLGREWHTVKLSTMPSNYCCVEWVIVASVVRQAVGFQDLSLQEGEGEVRAGSLSQWARALVNPLHIGHMPLPTECVHLRAAVR